MSFVRRKIELTFLLGTGEFGLMGYTQVVVSHVRVQCSVLNFLGPSVAEAHLRVYGLAPSLLNELSALNRVDMSVRQNRIIIKAGDEKMGMALIFEGQIQLSQIDMNAAPDVALNIMAFSGQLNALKTLEVISYPGEADAAVILANLANKMGMSFENSGASGPVKQMLSTPYYPGALMEQARRCAEDAGIDFVIEAGEFGESVMAIFPKGGARGGVIPLISPETGMVGYPTYSSGKGGIAVKCIFNPLLRIATPVKVHSDLHVANGQWLVFDIAHELDSEIPGGSWFTNFNGQLYGQ